MIDKILATLRKDNAITFAPADDKSIRFVGTMLASHKFANIPAEFIEFLKITDGLIWNGFEIYGTRAIDREDLGYTFPGLIEANLNFLNDDYLKGKLLLGKISEEIFVYNGLEHKFMVMDRINFIVNSVHSSFSEMVYSFIDEIY
ncbi:MAG: hypothetical protein BWY78_00478 [Alphaproteobacteria bacterium ADurb.Bin438]|nr:MAG: hypothetical protein BWY78_00478 [Alphaproteobacteria bacterium ADurb.Bin438]